MLFFRYTIVITLHVCLLILMTSPLWLAVGPRSLISGGLFTSFLNVCPFNYTVFAPSGTIVTPLTSLTTPGG